jgi:hypothetical protein
MLSYVGCSTKIQYCESRSGIRCFFDPWIWDPDPRSGMEKNPDPGSGMNIPGLIFENIVPYHFFGLKKYLNSMMEILNQDPGYCQPWIRDGKSLIRDVYPGSRIRIFPSRIPGQKDSGSRIWIKEFKYF